MKEKIQKKVSRKMVGSITTKDIENVEDFLYDYNNLGLKVKRFPNIVKSWNRIKRTIKYLDFNLSPEDKKIKY